MQEMNKSVRNYLKKMRELKEYSCMDKSIYEIIGIKENGEIRRYKSGTIKEIEKNEMLNQIKHNNIDDILRDMDCLSDYKHYAKTTKISKLN